MTDCLFCKMVSGEIAPDKVFENDDVLAFRDINPQAPTHVLVVPKRHVATLNDLDDESAGLVGKMALAAAEAPAGGPPLGVRPGPHGLAEQLAAGPELGGEGLGQDRLLRRARELAGLDAADLASVLTKLFGREPAAAEADRLVAEGLLTEKEAA